MTSTHSIVLAIETSSRDASVALRTADGSIISETLAPAHRHDDALMPAIERLCRQAHVQPDDLNVIGVSIGPGGFTGLRVGVITAKVLAETIGCDLVAVPTAAVVAASVNAGWPGADILVCLACKRSSVWVQRFTWEDGAWRERGAGAAAVAAELPINDVMCVVADDHLPSEASDVCRAHGISIRQPVFDAQACLALTISLHTAGKLVDPHLLTPLYAREPEAVTLWRARSRNERRSGC
ncbi:MAG: tRNA (adenosine(37)-N6)-threonylcarbamoyltransferase complex dimerization subunit type 1 TsaB [Phycisphaerales bacterium]|nr:tRNA (adenosine(37)-N6)-threonylcarbamoyltransferase complex dimerization subunit type 1 TsaB [Phycisphaerales bacterium]